MRKFDFDEKTIDQDKDAGFRRILREMAERTGMHGLPNIYRSNNIVKRLFWLLTTLVALGKEIKLFYKLCTIFISFYKGLLIWQVTDNILFFYSYPTKTTFQYLSTPSLPFPAVTFCNLNPIRKSKLDDSGEDLKKLLKVFSLFLTSLPE